MAVTYTQHGSKTTLPISSASFKNKVLWSIGNIFGFNIVRQRVAKKRYGVSKGETFRGFHFSKFSSFKELKNTSNGLWNPSMTVLEVPDSVS
jgi:hypothetical protein